MPMTPDTDYHALAAAIIDRSLPGNPRAWETAVEIRLDQGSDVLRSATSRHHRTNAYQVGRSMASETPLSKPLRLPAAVTERQVLRMHVGFNPASTQPTPIEDHARVLLHACVIVTPGATRAALIDTQRHQLALVPSEIGQILAARHDLALQEVLALGTELRPERIRHWLELLVAADFAFVTTEPGSRFPVVDLALQAPRAISNCVVDIDHESQHDLVVLAQELDALRCEHLELRYWTAIDADRLGGDLAAFEASRLRSIRVMAPASGIDTGQNIDQVIEELCVRHARLSLLTLYRADQDRILGGPYFRAEWTQSDPGSPNECGQIHPLYFSLGIESVLRARAGDSCLLGKLGIDARSTVRNCPSHPVEHGRLGQDPLLNIVQRPEYLRPGLQTKAEVSDCAVCEFRDICSPCQVRASTPTAKPETCRYDPHAATWDAADSP